MLVFQDPFCQRILIIAFLYPDAVLQNYWTPIQTLINEMYGAA